LEVMKPSATPAEHSIQWDSESVENGGLKVASSSPIYLTIRPAPNVLYAFVSLDAVLYVGKTVRSLKDRMSGYRNPVATQSTNIKVNKLIKETLAEGATVEIHALPDNGLLYYGGFHVNLAAGLGRQYDHQLKPKWNNGRNMTSKREVEFKLTHYQASPRFAKTRIRP